MLKQNGLDMACGGLSLCLTYIDIHQWALKDEEWREATLRMRESERDIYRTTCRLDCNEVELVEDFLVDDESQPLGVFDDAFDPDDITNHMYRVFDSP